MTIEQEAQLNTWASQRDTLLAENRELTSVKKFLSDDVESLTQTREELLVSIKDSAGELGYINAQIELAKKEYEAVLEDLRAKTAEATSRFDSVVGAIGRLSQAKDEIDSIVDYAKDSVTEMSNHINTTISSYGALESNLTTFNVLIRESTTNLKESASDIKSAGDRLLRGVADRETKLDTREKNVTLRESILASRENNP